MPNTQAAAWDGGGCKGGAHRGRGGRRRWGSRVQPMAPEQGAAGSSRLHDFGLLGRRGPEARGCRDTGLPITLPKPASIKQLLHTGFTGTESPTAMI